MRLTADQWHHALTDPPNYDIADFSVARITPIPQRPDDDVERPINALRVEAVHNGTGLEVVMTLRFPDSLVPFVAASLTALNQEVQRGSSS